VNVELINTGSELMLGRVLNTHQQWLCRRLADLGYTVARQVAVPDTGRDIEQAVREALSRADLLVTTGGLGPTSDDLTRDLIAQLLGKSLREDTAIVQHIEQFFAMRKRAMPASTRIQAHVPEGAVVLPNPHGTAPGLAMELRPNPFRGDGKPGWLIMLPGPPRELRPMFADAVVPLLQRVLRPESEFVCRTLRTTGVGESVVQERIKPLLEPLVAVGLELGYCARTGQVDVRLSAAGSEALRLVRDAESIVCAELGSFIYGTDDEEIETVIVRLLTERKQTLALAESCTGGCITHRITNVPGASAVLLAGLVTYSNEAKGKFLGVRAETLAEHGAVSEAVAREMAEGAREQTGADFALSVTGIAGPGGGTPAKPVGTVFIALAKPTGTVVKKNFNSYDRETFKQMSANQALELLRQKILAAK
jgi:nicotinamide-nucleotide amidase